MNRNPPISALMDRLRAEYGNRCARPGCRRRKLEFAHLCPTEVRGRSRGGRERYYDIRKHPSCYTLLCVQHHRLMDGPGGRDFVEPTLREGDMGSKVKAYMSGRQGPVDWRFSEALAQSPDVQAYAVREAERILRETEPFEAHRAAMRRTPLYYRPLADLARYPHLDSLQALAESLARFVEGGAL